MAASSSKPVMVLRQNPSTEVTQNELNAWPKTPFMSFVYAAASLWIGLSYGYELRMYSDYGTDIIGSIGVTPQENTWVNGGFYGAFTCSILFLFKFRLSFGLKLFAKIGVTVHLLTALLYFFVNDWRSDYLTRTIMGFATAPMGTIAVLYSFQWAPPQRQILFGVPIGIFGGQVMMSFAYVIAPYLENPVWPMNGLYVVDFGMALGAFAIVFLLPLQQAPTQRTFDWVDCISVPLMYAGVSLLCTMTSVGESYWWFNQPWIGEGYALAIALLSLFMIVEYNRKRPFLKISWIFTPQILWLFSMLVIYRILMSGQTYALSGFLTTFSELREQVVPIYFTIALAQTIGYLIVVATLGEENAPYILFCGLIFMTTGLWMNIDSSALTRSYQFVYGQTLLSLGGGLFLPTAMATGMHKSALAGGSSKLITYMIVFLTTQITGSLVDTAFFSTFFTYRTNFHTSIISSDLFTTSANVAARLKDYSAPYRAATSDPTAITEAGVKAFVSDIQQQEQVMSYNDIFVFLGIFGIISLIYLFLYLVYKYNIDKTQSHSELYQKVHLKG